jgi:hypothetical protein
VRNASPININKKSVATIINFLTILTICRVPTDGYTIISSNSFWNYYKNLIALVLTTNILNSAKVTQKVVLRMNYSVFQVYEV